MLDITIVIGHENRFIDLPNGLLIDILNVLVDLNLFLNMGEVL